MTFDELFSEHNLTVAERAALVAYLASLRMMATLGVTYYGERGMEPLIDDSDRLKPCPFCGGEAEIGQIEGDENTPNVGGMFVQCLNPRCEASSALIYPCGDDPKPLLMERWNKRPLESQRAQNEVSDALLRQALEALEDAKTNDDSIAKWDRHNAAIFHLRAAISEMESAQPEQAK